MRLGVAGCAGNLAKAANVFGRRLCESRWFGRQLDSTQDLVRDRGLVTRADPSRGIPGRWSSPWLPPGLANDYVRRCWPPRRESVCRRSASARRNPSRTLKLKISGVPKSVKLLEFSLLAPRGSTVDCKITRQMPLFELSAARANGLWPRSGATFDRVTFFATSSDCNACARQGRLVGRGAPRAYLRKHSGFGSWNRTNSWQWPIAAVCQQ